MFPPVALVPVASLRTFERNYREGDIGAIAESLHRFGQVKPIVVQQGTNRIIAGNHTWAAARSLGWEQIGVVFVQMDDTTAAAYAVADNRTSDLATNNEALLTELLRDLVAVGGMDALAGTGYDGDDVDRMLRRLNEESHEMLDSNEWVHEEKCPKCGHVFRVMNT